MGQAAENQPIEARVPNRFRVTAAPAFKAVRIPEEADPRTEHSRDPGCFAGEMGKFGRKL
jgi:hypothetical protein